MAAMSCFASQREKNEQPYGIRLPLCADVRFSFIDIQPNDSCEIGEIPIQCSREGTLFIRSAFVVLLVSVGCSGGSKMSEDASTLYDLSTSSDDLSGADGGTQKLQCNFQPPTSYAVAASSNALVSGDFNGDGKMDLATGSQGNNKVSVLIGNGDGTFQIAVDYATTDGGPRAMVVADMNGDHKADLVTTEGNVIDVFLGNGDGTFKAAIEGGTGGSAILGQLGTGDLNGDGLLDVATSDTSSHEISVFLGNGDGTVKVGLVTSLGNVAPGGIAIANFNADTTLDVVTANDDNTVTVFISKGDGTFQSILTSQVTAQSGNGSIGVGDLNGDQKLDLIVPGAVPSASPGYVPGGGVLFGNGNGTFQATRMFGSQMQAVFAPFLTEDLNLDGRLDVLSGDGIHFGNGDGTFQAAVPLQGGQLTADFNGDGKFDVAKLGGTGVQIFLGSGCM
ncbi:MAG: hypothetical protein JWM53_4792 [bacterium]|nr:hypothetical protein [bacterium]